MTIATTAPLDPFEHGYGLSSVSLWAREGVSATSFGVSTIGWLAVLTKRDAAGEA